jgi:hypothetical protein
MIDLRVLANRRYRIALEPPATGGGGVPDADRPWYYRIPCKLGHIGVWSHDRLSASTDRRNMRSRLEAIPDARVVQRGDLELTVTFPPERLEEVAELLHAYKRRRLSGATLDAACARLASIHERRRQALPRERAPAP